MGLFIALHEMSGLNVGQFWALALLKAILFDTANGEKLWVIRSFEDKFTIGATF
ncbi:hypothetical protein DPMN_092673 [Dreissena polymorpha]|uniref:Uncharacterized protein n=1 Tax=Dreissena polymorpha TaxID=45954 RepID=A0A9D4L1T3_DREPO|nr:hypothetical protein DPMN_092673 [Dreissena polymorpha]